MATDASAANRGSRRTALILGLLGGAAVVVSAFLNWISSGCRPSCPGTEFSLEFFWDPLAGPPGAINAGVVVIAIGAIILLGALLSRSWVMILGGALALVAVALVEITFQRIPVGGPGFADSGPGLYGLLIGGILAIVGGIVARRARD